MTVTYDWTAVQRYYDEGNDRDACIAKFGFTMGSWYKAIRFRRLKASLEPRYDWGAIKRFYDEGHTYRECKLRFGFKPATWTKAVRRGALVPRPRRPPLETILQKSRTRSTIKRRLLQAGKLCNRCDFCGLSEWRGQPLSIQIDHINGIRDDHRLENLRMLCPNCHSQTVTYGARNRKRLIDRHSRFV
jgi:5-methylcytosine-specific restriction endonuclease McrA